MTDISKEAVDALIEYTLNENVFSDEKQELTAQTLRALRAALDEAEANINLKADYIDGALNKLAAMEQRATEAEARADKAEAERDAANALLREARSGLCAYTGGASGACEMTILRIAAHLGAKP